MAEFDGRYDLLKRHLKSQAAERLRMTFAEIEGVIGKRLPRSAKLYNTWWSNNASNHVQAKAWLDAGYRTESVDTNHEALVFIRNGAPSGVAENQSESKPMDTNSGIHPLIGSMKGTFTIEPGWDITKPALDPEELEAWEASLDGKADMIERGLSKKP